MFENPDIMEMLDLIADDCIKRNIPFSLTTNGRILSSNQEYMDKLNEIKKKLAKKQFLIQVTDDERFYPEPLSFKQRYSLEKLGATIDSVPSRNIREKDMCLYPQGRALNYSEEWYDSIAPKCINCRIIPKQRPFMTFRQLVDELLQHQKLCTPCIDPNGNIKLGESRLCPVVSNIYKNDREIMDDILNCKCQACSHSIQRLKETNTLGYNMFII